MEKTIQATHSNTHIQQLPIENIYKLFLKKVKPEPICLYEKIYIKDEKGKNVKVKVPQMKLEGEVLKVAVNFSLVNFVAWKDNVIEKVELSQSKLAFSIVKSCFPQEYIYHEYAMNKHISMFLSFLLCDFDLTYNTEIFNFLYERPMTIEKYEMRTQMEILSQINEQEDDREKEIINDILDCFYDKKLAVKNFIHKLKNGLDFKALRKSAKKLPELKPFLQLA